MIIKWEKSKTYTSFMCTREGDKTLFTHQQNILVKYRTFPSLIKIFKFKFFEYKIILIIKHFILI